MISATAARTRAPAGQARDELGFVDIEANNHVKSFALFVENMIQRLRLQRGTGKPVENEPGITIGLRQSRFNNIDHQGIRNQVTPTHNLVNLHTERPAL